ncbi:MAG: carbohydrate kinase family protein [Acidimicrobiales bacterium]
MLKALPELGARPTIGVMGCFVQDIVVKPLQALVPGGSTKSRIVFAPGGFGPNVAWTAALEGASVRFLGHAGADAQGEALARELQDAGVDVAVTRKGATASVLVLVGTEGQRTMAYDTSSFTLTSEDVTQSQLAGLSLLHLYEDLFQDATAEGAWKAVAAVRRSGGLVSLDAGNVARIQQQGSAAFMGTVRKLAPEVLFANEEEAAALWPAGDVTAPGLVVVKHGPRPTVVYAADGTELLSVDVAPVADVVDTTGAGDAMAGAFLAAWAAGCDLREAVEAGHRAAGAVVAQYGARLPRSWVPSRPH